MSRFNKVSIMYVLLLLTSNLMAPLLVNIPLFGFGTIVMTSAAWVYPFAFMCGDVLTEVWGYRRTRSVIWSGFFANAALVAFSWLAMNVFTNVDPNVSKAFHAVFDMAPRMLLASFIGYLAGEFANSFVLDRMKKSVGHWPLWTRTIGSTLVGQVFDTIPFIGIAFWGILPKEVFWAMMINQYIFKCACEALGGTPLAYILVNWAKRDLQESCSVTDASVIPSFPHQGLFTNDAGSLTFTGVARTLGDDPSWASFVDGGLVGTSEKPLAALYKVQHKITEMNQPPKEQGDQE
jgi:uncharacterized integral membrane protein (TIGR00697 family)